MGVPVFEETWCKMGKKVVEKLARKSDRKMGEKSGWGKKIVKKSAKETGKQWTPNRQKNWCGQKMVEKD